MNARPEQLHSDCVDKKTEALDGDPLPSPPIPIAQVPRGKGLVHLPWVSSLGKPLLPHDSPSTVIALSGKLRQRQPLVQ